VHRHKIVDNGIRISFFRLHPNPIHETELIYQFNARIGEGNVATFKALGHYDVVCVYPASNDHQILFRGTIKGIRSFSNIDCVCWDDDSVGSIIGRLKECKALAILSIALDKESFTSGGIHHAEISKILPPGAIYLNSFSWGEQQLLIPKTDMNDLWSDTRSFLSQLGSRAADVYSVLALSMPLVQSLSSGNNGLQDKVDTDLTLEWHVQIRRASGALQAFRKILDRKRIETDGGFETTEFSTLFTNSQIICRVVGRNWGTIIKTIRDIRAEAADSLVSTKLLILGHFNE
jgi:hypothetical protein